jgi:hypothetical protein
MGSGFFLRRGNPPRLAALTRPPLSMRTVMVMLDDRWIHEAERLYRRYQLEIVEACGLCPWAERARVSGRFRIRVLLQADARGTDAATLAIDELTADPRAEVAVFVYPRLRLERLAFERFVAEVREVDAKRHPLGAIPYVFAGFHPVASPDSTDAERMIPFLRRTPDPTIQLLRSDVLDKVRSATPQGTQFVDLRALERLDTDAKEPAVSLRQRIARTNLATVERLGVEEVSRRMDAIVEDRVGTYRELESAAAVAEIQADLRGP